MVNSSLNFPDIVENFRPKGVLTHFYEVVSGVIRDEDVDDLLFSNR